MATVLSRSSGGISSTASPMAEGMKPFTFMPISRSLSSTSSMKSSEAVITATFAERVRPRMSTGVIVGAPPST